VGRSERASRERGRHGWHGMEASDPHAVLLALTLCASAASPVVTPQSVGPACCCAWCKLLRLRQARPPISLPSSPSPSLPLPLPRLLAASPCTSPPKPQTSFNGHSTKALLYSNRSSAALLCTFSASSNLSCLAVQALVMSTMHAQLP
jgi:hypothetical protein